MNTKFLPSSLALAAVAAAPMLASADVNEFYSELKPLNAAFDADGVLPSGEAFITVNDNGVAADGMSGVATIRVKMLVTGVEDIAAIPGAGHVAHIHGQFAANEGLPAGQQTDGPFFEGEGGTAVPSIVPSLADDGDGDGFLNFFEGLPSYGPVVLNLGSQAVADNTTLSPDGVPPLINAINFLSDNGLTAADVFPTGEVFDIDTLYTFDMADDDARRVFNNLTPLTTREIVVHGLTVPANISDPIDAAAIQLGLPAALLGIPVDGTGEEFRTTAPIAAGSIVAVPTPSAALAGLSILGGLMLRRRRSV